MQTLVSYTSRPPIADKRLYSAKGCSDLIYEFKSPYSDGTWGIKMDGFEILEKISALIPPPWFNMIRYYGVFAPNSKLRSSIILNPNIDTEKTENSSSKPSWSDLLKRIFNLDVDKCEVCGGRMKLISAINNRDVILKILTHIGKSTDPPDLSQRSKAMFSYFLD